MQWNNAHAAEQPVRIIAYTRQGGPLPLPKTLFVTSQIEDDVSRDDAVKSRITPHERRDISVADYTAQKALQSQLLGRVRAAKKKLARN